SFSMYQVFAELSLAKFIPVNFKNNLFDVDLMIDLINKYNPKLVLICTPNNPNGAFLEEKEIRRIAESSKGLVLLDLAYIDFAKCDYTYLGMEYDNIIAFRTFSKAMSLPSIRVGYAISNEDNINMINAIKPPYSVTSLSLVMAEIAIKNYDLYKDNISKIKNERERLIKEFKALGYNPLPSEANFIYLNIDKELDDLLIKNKIYIRKFKTGPARITVGSALENDELLRVVKLYEKSRN
ncbi:MAG: histidinol-phosphate aminotransferase family protein, partial [Acholeplasmatales bacterium]|nr:histidinol-phosphate aminotransferase family protein [Acholeplasmatales bacterium]